MKHYLLVISIFLICIFLNTSINAQENNDLITRFEKLVGEKNDLVKQLKEEQGRTDSLKNVIKNLKSELKKKEEEESNTLNSIEEYKKSIVSKDSIIEYLNRSQDNIDDIRRRYINGVLYLPYDENVVERAKLIFNEIENENMKKSYYFLPDLLNNYKGYLDSVKKLLESLNNIEPDRYEYDNFKNAALRQIKNNKYVKFSEEQKKKNEYSIFYLDKIIKITENLIEKSDKDKMVDFTAVIELLNTN